MTEPTYTITLAQAKQLADGEIAVEELLNEGDGRAFVSPEAAELLGLAGIGGAAGAAVHGLADRGDAQTPAGQLGESGAALDNAYLSEIQGPIVEGASSIDTLHPVTIVKENASTSRPNGSVVLEYAAIPDSVTYQFVASSTSSGSDWTSEDGSLTLSATGSPTIQSNDLNGEDTLLYDGVDDYHRTTNISITQPLAIVAVYQYQATGQGGSRAISDTDAPSSELRLDPDDGNGKYEIYAGNRVDNTATDTQWRIHSGIFDGANSESRLDGSTDASGDAGSNDPSGLEVAHREAGDHTEIKFAEFWVLDNPSLQDVKDSEQILNNKYAVY